MTTLTATTAMPARAQSRAVSFDDVVFSGLVVLLAWVPFWFGSNSALAWGINAVACGSLLVGYELGLMLRGAAHPVALRRIWFPALAFALVVLWIVVQMSLWTPVDWHNPVWGIAAEALESPVQGSISINRDVTALALMRLITAAAVFWVSLQLCRNARRAKRMLQAIVVIGVLYALYGIIAFSAFPNTILWFGKTVYVDSVTSTFVNRNSFATYAGMAVVAGLALFLSALEQARQAHSWRIKVERSISALMGQGSLLLAGCIVMVLALLMTGSRAGITVSLVCAFGLLILFQVRARTRSIAGIMISLTLLVGLVTLLLSFGEFYATRMERVGIEAEGRLAVYHLTWTSVWNQPWTGLGYGTFQQAFPMFRDASVGSHGLWDMAHNTHLEVLQGLGIVGGSLIIAAALALTTRCLIGAFRRKEYEAAPIAAGVGTILVGLHALVDFSLQIQAVTLTWAALLGAGVAQSWSARAGTAGAHRGGSVR